MYNRCFDMGMDMPAQEPMKINMDHKKGMHFDQHNMGQSCLPGIVCPPIYEQPTERVCHREIVHEVPHICPVNTRIVNHHIYRHTFAPCYTCCEENIASNLYEGNCCF